MRKAVQCHDGTEPLSFYPFQGGIFFFRMQPSFSWWNVPMPFRDRTSSARLCGQILQNHGMTRQIVIGFAVLLHVFSNNAA
jgi:hypothetical protein